MNRWGGQDGASPRVGGTQVRANARSRCDRFIRVHAGNRALTLLERPGAVHPTQNSEEPNIPLGSRDSAPLSSPSRTGGGSNAVAHPKGVARTPSSEAQRCLRPARGIYQLAFAPSRVA